MTATPDPLRTRCPVCASPYREQYHALKLAKVRYEDMTVESRKLGRAIKRTTFGKHFRICLKGQDPILDSQVIADQSKGAQGQAEIDFAVMVQKRATELLQTGQLRVTAQHGLTAQALLDRRAEKQADRDIALNIARLLSGSMVMAPGMVIEGRAVPIDPLEITDGLLAPDGLFEPVT